MSKKRFKVPRYLISEVEKKDPLELFKVCQFVLRVQKTFWVMALFAICCWSVLIWSVSSQIVGEVLFITLLGGILGIVGLLFGSETTFSRETRERNVILSTEAGKKAYEIFRLNFVLFKKARFTEPTSLRFDTELLLTTEERSHYISYFNKMRELLKLAYIDSGLAQDENAVYEMLIAEADQVRQKSLQRLTLDSGASGEEIEAALKELSAIMPE